MRLRSRSGAETTHRDGSAGSGLPARPRLKTRLGRKTRVRVYNQSVTWPWIALLVVAVVVVVAAEWPRVSRAIGEDARRRRDRERRKAKLSVVPSEHEEFVASVQRDLDRLPTIEERESGRLD